MMQLYQLIQEAVEQKDIASAWKLILLFEPLIIKHSINPYTKQIDEDLKSEIQLKLLLRILNNYEIRYK